MKSATWRMPLLIIATLMPPLYGLRWQDLRQHLPLLMLLVGSRSGKGPLGEKTNQRWRLGGQWAPSGRPYIPSAAICRSWAAERSAHCERTFMPALVLDGGGTGLS
jgi:hypothetical protein